MTNLSMKLRTAFAASALVLASLASAPRVHAQRPLAQANIPFDFQCGKAHLDSGHYTISTVVDNTIELQSRPTSAFDMVQWSDNRASTTGKLVFAKYGDVYILKEVWMPGQTQHARLPQTKAERALQELAQSHQAAAPSDVIVAFVEPTR